MTSLGISKTCFRSVWANASRIKAVEPKGPKDLAGRKFADV